MTIEHFGDRLKELLDDHGMSIRACSKETGIDKATISRIINGKRKANINHLTQFAACFDVPLMALMEGEAKAEETSETSEISISMEEIQLMLKEGDFYDGDFDREDVRKKLSEYEQYVQTEEGKQTIHDEFGKKIEKVGSIGPFIDHLKGFYAQFVQHKGTRYKLAVMGSVLLYFIVPVDVIPDYIFPIGYVDDAFAVKLALKTLSC